MMIIKINEVKSFDEDSVDVIGIRLSDIAISTDSVLQSFRFEFAGQNSVEQF